MTYGDTIRGPCGLATACCKSSFVLFSLVVTVNSLDVSLLPLLHAAAAVDCLMVVHVHIHGLLLHAHDHIWRPTVLPLIEELLLTVIIITVFSDHSGLLRPLGSVEDFARDVDKSSFIDDVHSAAA